MIRVKRGNISRKNRFKILRLANGFKGAHSRLFRTANGQVMKSLIYAYIGRKSKKTNFKRLWMGRLNSVLCTYGLSYNKFRNGLKTLAINFNLKILAQIALLDPKVFFLLVCRVKYGL